MKLRVGDKFLAALLVILTTLWLASYPWGFRLIVRYDDSLVIESSNGDLHVGHTEAPMIAERVRVEPLDADVRHLFTGVSLLNLDGPPEPLRNDVVAILPGAQLYWQRSPRDGVSLARGVILPHAYFAGTVAAVWAAMWGWRRRMRRKTQSRNRLEASQDSY